MIWTDSNTKVLVTNHRDKPFFLKNAKENRGPHVVLNCESSTFRTCEIDYEDWLKKSKESGIEYTFKSEESK